MERWLGFFVAPALLHFGVSALLALGAKPAVAADDFDRIVFVLGTSSTVEVDEQVTAAIVVGGDLTIRGQVGGPAVAVGGDLEVRPTAVVAGSAIAFGGEVRIDEGAQVNGARAQVAAGDFGAMLMQLEQQMEAQRDPSPWLASLGALVPVVAVFVIALLIAAVAPGPLSRVEDTLQGRPLLSALVGMGVALGCAPLCFVLGMTGVGLVLIPLLMALYVGALLVGFIGFACVVGRRVARRTGLEHRIGQMSIGFALLAVVAVVPVFGAILLSVGAVWSSGAVFLSISGWNPKSSADPIARQLRSEISAAEG